MYSTWRRLSHLLWRNSFSLRIIKSLAAFDINRGKHSGTKSSVSVKDLLNKRAWAPAVTRETVTNPTSLTKACTGVGTVQTHSQLYNPRRMVTFPHLSQTIPLHCFSHITILLCKACMYTCMYAACHYRQPLSFPSSFLTISLFVSFSVI